MNGKLGLADLEVALCSVADQQRDKKKYQKSISNTQLHAYKNMIVVIALVCGFKKNKGSRKYLKHTQLHACKTLEQVH